MKKQTTKNIRKRQIIISAPKYRTYTSHIQLLRISLSSLHTKIDFGYKAAEYYYAGGWITISPETFIRPKGTDQKLILTNASNIPYGPEKHHFNSKLEWKYFSLYFPTISDDVQEFDLIEKETKEIDPTQFNFYQVLIHEKEKQLIPA